MKTRFPVLVMVALVFALLFTGIVFADKASSPAISPWAQVYSNYQYNISGYEDFDERFDDNDANKFELTRVWLGLDAALSKSWSARVVLGADRANKYTYETVMVSTGEGDDPATEEDESTTEVLSAVNSTKAGMFDVYVTYAFFTYRPFQALAFDMGMISNAYNTQIYKYWKFNYVDAPTIFKHRLTRSLYGDLGAAIWGDFPKGYGSYRVTVLNGEGKKAAEANAGKAAEARVTVNPFQFVDPLKGLSLTGFYRYDRQEPDVIQVTNMLYDGILSYSLPITDSIGFSLTGEFAQLTVMVDQKDVDPVVSQMIAGWADFWFLKDMGFMARYDYIDPNIENDKDKRIGYQDEQGHLIAGYYFNPIKPIKLCLNYRNVSYTAQILDDKEEKVAKQSDQYLFFNTEFKFK